jgi:hypothetical protein
MRSFLAAILLFSPFSGCAYHSPGAKVSTVINVSIMPPATSALVPSL